jgi:hypothetical protein
MNATELCEELQNNFAFAPLGSTESVLEKLAEKKRREATTVSCLNLYWIHAKQEKN